MSHLRYARALLFAAFALLLGAAAAYAQATVAGNTDVALVTNGGKLLSYSSQALDANGQPIPEWQAANLIDGKHVVGNFVPADSYGWSSNRAPSEEDPEWVVIGFTDPTSGQEVTRLISRVVIDPVTDDPSDIGRWIKSFAVQVSSDNPQSGPWKTVGRFLVVNRPVRQTFDFPPTEAKYVRLLITANQGSDRFVEVGEMEVYEAIVPGEQLDSLITRLENLLEDLKHYRDSQAYQRQQAQSTAPAGSTTPTPAPAPTGPVGPAGPGGSS